MRRLAAARTGDTGPAFVGDEEESMSSTRGPREPSIEAVRTPDLRGSLQLSGVLLTAGFVVYLGVSVLHPAGVDPNDHPAVSPPTPATWPGRRFTWASSRVLPAWWPVSAS